jgi:hypothetical protein
MTGQDEDFFFQIYDDLTKNTKRRIRSVLHPHLQLLLVLHWLRDFPKLKNLGVLFQLDKGTVSRHISNLLPKVYISLRRLAPISFPPTIKPHQFESVIGVVDCTSHLRWRVHPRQI